MRVAPTLQRRGLGQAILSALIDEAVASGMAAVHLETTTGQIAARRFYEKNGFACVATGRQGRFEVMTYRRELT
jgi:ribosomal protein S18 acetylase RimI-like enzyme